MQAPRAAVVTVFEVLLSSGKGGCQAAGHLLGEHAVGLGEGWATPLTPQEQHPEHPTRSTHGGDNDTADLDTL